MYEDFSQTIDLYLNNANDRNHSWSLFYHFFNDGNECHKYDSVHLMAYLASWGMYRASSRLFQNHNYTVHDGAVAIIRQPKYQILVGANLQTYTDPVNFANLITLIEDLKTHYRDKGVTPTDTLISKILMGCIACIPAYDRYFVIGARAMFEGMPINLTTESISGFFEQLEAVPNIDRNCHQGLQFPFFKKVDMYFFQQGIQLQLNE